MAWIRKTGAFVTEWCAAEASSLTFNGQALLMSNAEVVASVRRGFVEVEILDGTLPADLVATFHVPFSPLGVFVNGDPATFSASGATITIGTPGPALSTEDRYYAFAYGDYWDAIPSGALTITADEKLVCTSAWGALTLRGGQLNPVRPVSVGLSASFDPTWSGERIVIKMETVPSAGDVLTVGMGLSPNPGFFRVDLRTDGTTGNSAGTFDVPYGVTPDLGRVALTLDPTTGVVKVYDSGGPLIGTATVFPAAGPFRTRITLGRGVAVDDVTYFDSEEDGQSPRGIAFWLKSGGRAGFAMRAPSVCTYDLTRLRVGNEFLPQEMLVQWMVVASFYPTSLATSPSGGMPGLDELVWESFSVAAPSMPAIPIQLEAMQPGGMSMIAEPWIF
jgi:hypothetical protein